MLMFALIAAAAVAPAEGKTMAMDDWSALSIYGVGSDAAGATYLQVHGGDLDGDGLSDDAVVKITCSDGQVTQSAYWLAGPRDMATGQASGKRMHKPFTIVKEWGPASPQLLAVKPTYNVKQLNSARISAVDDWTPLTLAHSDGLCPAASAAAKAVVKSKSNITNNRAERG
jgi:hypothetical protein